MKRTTTACLLTCLLALPVLAQAQDAEAPEEKAHRQAVEAARPLVDKAESILNQLEV